MPLILWYVVACYEDDNVLSVAAVVSVLHAILRMRGPCRHHPHHILYTRWYAGLYSVMDLFLSGISAMSTT